VNYRKCCFVRKMMPYNKLLTNFTCSGPYWGILALGHFCTTSGQYSPVRSSRSVSKRLILNDLLTLFRPGGGGQLCLHALWTFITFLIRKLKPPNLVTFLGAIWYNNCLSTNFDVNMHGQQLLTGRFFF